MTQNRTRLNARLQRWEDEKNNRKQQQKIRDKKNMMYYCQHDSCLILRISEHNGQLLRPACSSCAPCRRTPRAGARSPAGSPPPPLGAMAVFLPEVEDTEEMGWVFPDTWAHVLRGPHVIGSESSTRRRGSGAGARAGCFRFRGLDSSDCEAPGRRKLTPPPPQRGFCTAGRDVPPSTDGTERATSALRFVYRSGD